MPDRVKALEAQVAALLAEQESLRQRVALLERAAAGPAAPARRRRAAAPEAATAGVAQDVAAAAALAPLAGRTLLVLAGAFVLRALTDAGVLPAAAGVALGFAYAAAVLALCARATRPVDATFHGATAVLVGFPLLLEATTRFQLLGPWASGALLAALGAAVLAVAARRGLPWVGWAGAAAALATALGLMVATGRLAPAALALTAVGALAFWIGEPAGGRGLRWPLAAGADFAVLALAARSVAPTALEGPGLAQGVAGVLLVAWLGSFTVRTLALGRGVAGFEVLQSGGALLAGLGGAALAAARAGEGTAILGAASLVASAAAYAVAFLPARRGAAGPAAATYHAAVALAFALAGAWLAIVEPWRGLVLALLAVAAAALGVDARRRTLLRHAAVLALAAAGAAGLLRGAEAALFSSGAVAWPPPAATALAALACLVAAAALAARDAGRATMLARAPQAALDAAAAASAAGVVAGWVAAALGPPGPEADLGVLATGRTAVLAGGAALAAALGRREAAREAGWLAWPLLGVLGLKLVLQDFPRGRPATLILSLAFTGAALILVPRLRARRPAAAPAAAAPSDAVNRAG